MLSEIILVLKSYPEATLTGIFAILASAIASGLTLIVTSLFAYKQRKQMYDFQMIREFNQKKERLYYESLEFIIGIKSSLSKINTRDSLENYFRYPEKISNDEKMDLLIGFNKSMELYLSAKGKEIQSKMALVASPEISQLFKKTLLSFGNFDVGDLKDIVEAKYYPEKYNELMNNDEFWRKFFIALKERRREGEEAFDILEDKMRKDLRD